MNAIPIHTHRKTVEINGRIFVIQKFSSMLGLKVTKVLVSKVLPVFGGFAPLLEKLTGTAGQSDDFGGGSTEDTIVKNLKEILSPDGITKALDSIAGDDLDYIIRSALTHCAEQLAEGLCPVMRENGTFGIADVQYSLPMTMRLTCEAVLWGLGDFFDAKNLVSLLSPLGSSWRSMQPTSTDTSSPPWNPDTGSSISFGTEPTL